MCRFWQYGFNQLSIEISFLFIFSHSLLFTFCQSYFQLTPTSRPNIFINSIADYNMNIYIFLVSYRAIINQKRFATFKTEKSKMFTHRSKKQKAVAKSNGSQQLIAKTEYTFEIQSFGVIVLIKFSYRFSVARALINYSN